MKCPECDRETKAYWFDPYGIGPKYYMCECGKHWDSKKSSDESDTIGSEED